MANESPPKTPAPTSDPIFRHCLACGYNLTGLGDGPRCPECGLVHVPQAFREEVWKLLDSGKWFFSRMFHPFEKRPPGWWWALDRPGDVKRSFRFAARSLILSIAIVCAGYHIARSVWIEQEFTSVLLTTSGRTSGVQPIPVDVLRQVRGEVYSEGGAGSLEVAELVMPPGSLLRTGRYRCKWGDPGGPRADFTGVYEIAATPGLIWGVETRVTEFVAPGLDTAEAYTRMATPGYPTPATSLSSTPITRKLIDLHWSFDRLLGLVSVWLVTTWWAPAMVGIWTQIRRGLPSFARAPRTIIAAANYESHRLVYVAALMLLFFCAGAFVSATMPTVTVSAPMAVPLTAILVALVFALAGWIGPLRSDYTRQLIRRDKHAARIVFMYVLIFPFLVCLTASGIWLLIVWDPL